MEIKKWLIKKFSEERYENNKLPSEATLAKELEISLVTLRESLMMLALEGFITKRHGSGNYVHPSAFDPTNRMDMGISFADAFRHQGFEPGMNVIGISQSLAGEEYAGIFGIGAEDIVASTEVVYTANGLPSVYSIELLPELKLIKPFKIGKANFNFHEFVLAHCGIHMTHSLNDYKAVNVPEKVAKLFGIPVNTPILYCEQLFYDIKDEPIFFNKHYFHPERYGVRMLQNWDLYTK